MDEFELWVRFMSKYELWVNLNYGRGGGEDLGKKTLLFNS